MIGSKTLRHESLPDYPTTYHPEQDSTLPVCQIEITANEHAKFHMGPGCLIVEESTNGRNCQWHIRLVGLKQSYDADWDFVGYYSVQVALIVNTSIVPFHKLYCVIARRVSRQAKDD